mgnify:CR=1 FL=1
MDFDLVSDEIFPNDDIYLLVEQDVLKFDDRHDF